MNVFIRGPIGHLKPVLRRMIAQGTKIVDSPEKADFCLAADGVHNQSPPTVGGYRRFEESVAQAVGFKQERPPSSLKLLVGRWFDVEWRDQIIVGVEARGLNGGLGPLACFGIATRYVDNPLLRAVTDQPGLKKLLQAQRFIGLVTLDVHLYSETEAEVKGITLGGPPFMLYNLLEGVRVPYEDFFTSDIHTKETWVSNILLTRWPYPKPSEETPFVVKGLNENILRHFWDIAVEDSPHGRFSYMDLVGCATSYSPRLTEAVDLGLITCGNIQFENKLYRTDILEAFRNSWVPAARFLKI